VDQLHGFLFCRWIRVIHPRLITCSNFLRKLLSSSARAIKFSWQMCCRRSFCSVLTNFGIQRAETLFIPKSSCKIFNTVASYIFTSSAIIETLILRSAKTKISTLLKFSLVFGFNRPFAFWIILT
jgi:hypothetical protein